MQIRWLYIVFSLIFVGQTLKNNSVENEFSKVKIEPVFIDSISIRAIQLKENFLFYAGNNGKYGYINLNDLEENYQYKIPGKPSLEFRASASTENSDFILSVGNPALLYEVTISGKQELNYQETDTKVFYDSMEFWNEKEGIAIGDPTEDCMSIIITRDSGKTWQKIPCSNLPKVISGEAAFAASNSNISIFGNKTWIISGGMASRVYYSPNKGKTWEVFDTPLIEGKSTTGGYSIDFYNEKIGIIFGGDYTAPNDNQANKAITFDGGKTWKLLASNEFPGYKSCVQFVPESNGNEIVAVGPSGISYSFDRGKTWEELSKEGFYTLRFLNDSTAFAAGKNRICKLTFEK